MKKIRVWLTGTLLRLGAIKTKSHNA